MTSLERTVDAKCASELTAKICAQLDVDNSAMPELGDLNQARSLPVVDLVSQDIVMAAANDSLPETQQHEACVRQLIGPASES
jgi:hypothetical protein